VPGHGGHPPTRSSHRASALLATQRIPGAWVTPVAWLDDPFTLGVASGDPTPTEVVLWTRLAPRPLEPDRCTVIRDRWYADLRVVDTVERSGTPVRILASYVVESGRPGAEQV
jgi:phosphodiesterase/alkaline phosphatase D-like protein